MSEPVLDILESFGLKPYVIQQQPAAQHGNAQWEIIQQFDTLEEARAAFAEMRSYGKMLFRIAAARPYIQYDPVL